MLDCLIIGDSIAVGAHQFKPECVSYSKGGVTSHGWDRLFGSRDLTAGTVIISLGTNDWAGADTYGKLREIREKITGRRVFWIAPNKVTKPRAYKDVNLIAGLFGDTVITTQRYQTDRIHPSWAGYRELVEQTK